MYNWVEQLAFPHRSVYLKGLSEVWGVNVQTIVEIGVWRGTNARMMRYLFPEAQFYLVDPWEVYPEYKKKEAESPSLNPKYYELAYQKVVKTFQNDNRCTILRKTSREAASLVPNGIDLVFIDGNHSYEYVKEDINLWMPKVASGGILAGHDHKESDFPGLVRAVQETLGTGNYLLGQDHVWAYLKQS